MAQSGEHCWALVSDVTESGSSEVSDCAFRLVLCWCREQQWGSVSNNSISGPIKGIGSEGRVISLFELANNFAIASHG
jgi:hypothetical protein